MGYSAIIVLGNLMSQEGELNIESSSRMNLAIEAFHENQAPYIVTCGWAYRTDSPITIADAMRNYAIKIGKINPESIITERNSRDTVGDAIFTKNNIALKREWKNIIVVTSDYHVSRTKIIFNYIYGKPYNIEVKGAAADIADEQLNIENTSLMAFYDTFEGIEAGDDALIYKRLYEKHPFYNGDVYPKISKE
jgi:uncharacterized SAM-binding protein YcdF (DUF218 family)